MKLTVLGSGGWIPTQQRETCSYLVEVENTLILLDAGTGISRLKEYPHILKEYKEINIILSHYHLDHIVGLSFLPMFMKGHALNIYAPNKIYYEDSASSILSTFTSNPYFSREIFNFSKDVNIYEYDTKGFTINNLNIGILEQKHSAPSFGITLGKYLHYSTDTSVIEETFKIAQSVGLLLHECWQFKSTKSSVHSSLEEICEKSKLCENTKIGLIHINPSWGNDEFIKLEKKIKDLNILIVMDKMNL